jgi:sialic acid synthase SpsE
MIIGGRDLTRERMLIAEIGNNHEGDSKLALELASAAAESGADVIKVQLIDPERLVHISQTQRIEQLTRFRLPMPTFEEMAQRSSWLRRWMWTLLMRLLHCLTA